MVGIKCKGVKISSQIKTDMIIEPIREYSTSYEKDKPLMPAEELLVDLDSELQEEFYAVMERIKCEELTNKAKQIETVDIKLDISPEKYKVPISEQSLEFPKVISELNNDTPSPLLCRLCAKRGNAMVCMFNPNEVEINVIERVEYCFNITIQKTDTLSKRVCLLCLEKLEVCYHFHKTVVQAEKKLLMIDGQASSSLKDTDKYCGTSSRRNEYDATICADSEEKLKALVNEYDATICTDSEEKLKALVGEDTNDIESTTVPEEVEITDTTLENNIISSNFELHSKWLFPEEMYHEKNPNEDKGPRSSSDEYQSTDLTVDALLSSITSASQLENGSSYSAPNIPKQVEELRSTEKMSEPTFHFPSITRTHRGSNSVQKEVRKDDGDDDIIFSGEVFGGQTVGCEMISCRICGATFQSVEKFDEHASIHNSRNYYPCCLCDKTVATKKDWKEHSLQHTEVQKLRRAVTHNCSECGKKFATQAELKIHQLDHKSNAKIHCEKCFEVMDSETSLQRHMLTVHEQHEESSDKSRENQLRTLNQRSAHQRKLDVDFHCTSYRNFRFNYLMEEHRTIYCNSLSTKKKNFSCSYCGKGFQQKGNVTIHERKHTGERPYGCNFCAKSFTTKASRDCHHRIHTGERPFKCSICEKTFSWAASLRHHAYVHSEIRPYKCPLCPQSFKISRTRDEHVLIHTGERPYQCSVCGSGFKRQYNLRMHKANYACLAKLDC